MKRIDQKTRDDVFATLAKLNVFLEKSEWFAGDELSLADLGFLASVGTFKVNDFKYLQLPVVQNVSFSA